MNWIIILLVIVVLIFIITKLTGSSTEEAASSAAAGGLYAGSCMLQIFLYGIGILILLWLFGALFG